MLYELISQEDLHVLGNIENENKFSYLQIFNTSKPEFKTLSKFNQDTFLEYCTVYLKLQLKLLQTPSTPLMIASKYHKLAPFFDIANKLFKAPLDSITKD